jgi:hypothetical protein
MTDKKSLADGVRERVAVDSPHAHQEPDRRGWTAAIKHRWPTWLAIALAALTVGDHPSGCAKLFQTLWIPITGATIVIIAVVYHLHWFGPSG